MLGHCGGILYNVVIIIKAKARGDGGTAFGRFPDREIRGFVALIDDDDLNVGQILAQDWMRRRAARLIPIFVCE